MRKCLLISIFLSTSIHAEIYSCNDDLQECKFYNENGQALFYDELHLTKEGLNLYGKKFVKTLCKIDPLFCK